MIRRVRLLDPSAGSKLAAEQLVASWLGGVVRQSLGLAGPPSADAIAKRVRYAVDTLVRAWSTRPLSKLR
jgi:hypothetical protein